MIRATLLCLLLTGCASTRDFIDRHPVAVGVGASVLITSIALSSNSNHHSERATEVSAPLVTCQPAASCQ